MVSNEGLPPFKKGTTVPSRALEDTKEHSRELRRVKRPFAALNPNNIPDELKRRHQWVTWKLVKRRNGEWTKEPYDARTGRKASSTELLTWATFEEALAAFEVGGYDGVGFVFSSEDPYTGIDLDDARDPETGELAEWAQEIIEAFGSYCEVSPSGTGVHIYVRGDVLSKKGDGIEVYSTKRFFTVTGVKP